MSVDFENGFRLAHWRIRPRAGRLSSGLWRKTVRRVEPKAMQVLLALAAPPGRFRSKDDLLASVWAGRAVSDDCLTGAIHALRHALGDNPRDPRFIETRTNVGYRLIAEVRPITPLPRFAALAACIALIVLATVFVATDPSSHSADPQPLTLAVLPFVNQSGTTGDDYFAAAMTDTLISDLAQGRRVRVISRTSVTGLGDDAGSAQEVARQLGADMLIEGSVQTAGDQVRVSAQLYDPFSSEHLWAQRYHRSLGNVFELQRDISREIAARIGVVIGFNATPADSLPPDQLQRYLQARFLLAKDQAPEARMALRDFSDLTAAQPGFAPAWLGRAESLLFLFKTGVLDRDALREATTAALRYEDLAGASPASHRSLGQIRLFLDWDFAGAEARYRQALLQNDSDTIARHRYAWLLVAQQRYAEASEQIRHIRLLDPLYYVRPGLATLLLYANEVDAAIVEFERLDANTTLDKVVLRIMATAYLAAGRDEDARRTLIRMLRAASTVPAADIDTLSALDNDGLYRHILKAQPFRSPIVSAGFHTLLGDTEAALRDLEAAVERHDPYVFYLAALPELADLRAHPRFVGLLSDIGIDAVNQRVNAVPKLSSASNR